MQYNQVRLIPTIFLLQEFSQIGHVGRVRQEPGRFQILIIIKNAIAIGMLIRHAMESVDHHFRIGIIWPVGKNEQDLLFLYRFSGQRRQESCQKKANT